MRKTAAVLLAAVLLLAPLLALAGCGGGTDDATVAMLMDSSRAMSEVSGYRLDGKIDMSAGASETGGQDQTISMEIKGEVQNVAGETRQHMDMSMGGLAMEAYIIGAVYYQYVPEQGWMKMSTGAYQAQNMNLSLLDPEQMELIGEMAKTVQVIEEDEERIGLSFHLDKGFFQASLELSRKYLQEGEQADIDEYLRMMEEYVTGFDADIRIWLRKADDLVERMEMDYTMVGLPQVGEVRNSMHMEFHDYGQDIVVELPPEAEQATEIGI